MNKRSKLAAAGILTVGVLFTAPTAFAADTVTQAVTSGSRTAAVTNVTLTSVAYSHSDGAGTGTMTLNVNDLTGTGAGWNVTEQVSDFVWSAGTTGAINGTDIPAANFSITPGTVSGGADTASFTVGGAGSPSASPIKVVSAPADSGLGAYTQSIGASLTIPADSRAGTYTGTLTTLITAGP